MFCQYVLPLRSTSKFGKLFYIETDTEKIVLKDNFDKIHPFLVGIMNILSYFFGVDP